MIIRYLGPFGKRTHLLQLGMNAKILFDTIRHNHHDVLELKPCSIQKKVRTTGSVA